MSSGLTMPLVTERLYGVEEDGEDTDKQAGLMLLREAMAVLATAAPPYWFVSPDGPDPHSSPRNPRRDTMFDKALLDVDLVMALREYKEHQDKRPMRGDPARVPWTKYKQQLVEDIVELARMHRFTRQTWPVLLKFV